MESPSRRFSVLSCSTLILLMLAALPASAQPQEPVPRIEEAEAIFQQALDAFQAEDYGMAFRRFRFVYDSYPLHRKTTAAVVMAGKALYRDGAYEQAAAHLSEFIRAYPTSGYLDDADRTRRLAERALDGLGLTTRPVRLGIALPQTDADAGLTQSLFNGIRLAVEAHNRTEETPVQMVFRSSGGTQAAARNAVVTLAGSQQTDLIVGPLYSDEARGAAPAAEQSGVVLMAPLANDASVSQGRRFVFQANPTIPARGRLMARFAVEELGLRRFGIAAERDNDLGERMAEGFQQEALRLGAEVVFFELLPSAREWSELPARIGEDLLRDVDALYLPMEGRNAHRSIESVLNSLDRNNLSPRVLGNSAWQGLSAGHLATAFGVIYTDDFYVDDDDAAVRAFDRDYRALAGEAPGRLAYVGYDVTRFLLRNLPPDGLLPSTLQSAPPYQGLGMQIDLDGGNTNEALFFLRYRTNDVVPYR